MNNESNGHVETLNEVVKALEFHGDGTLTFMGHSLATPSPGRDSADSSNMGPLQQLLYTYAYTRPFSLRQGIETTNPEPQNNWVGRLMEANTSQERWDPGWTVQSVLPGGSIVVVKERRRRVIAAGQYASFQTHGQAIVPGCTVSVFVARDSLTLQDGFYYIFGETLTDASEETHPLRFYVNVGVETTERWIRKTTTDLNRYRVPFRLKVITAPEQQLRNDGAVIFVHRRYLRIVTELLAHGAAELLRDSPLFTLPLLPGLSLAEDPGNGESFGMHRCRLVSEAIWQGSPQQTGLPFSVENMMQTIQAHFEAHGIDWQRPYLKPGSSLMADINSLAFQYKDLVA